MTLHKFVEFHKRQGDVIGVEVKTNGTLSKLEKQKCKWYLERGMFRDILIASKLKKKNRVSVDYVDVTKILDRMR